MRALSRPTVVTLLAAGGTVASIAGTAGYLVGRYPLLPSVIAVEFRDGHPYTFLQKSYAMVLTPVWTQLILLFVIGGVAALLLWRAHGAALDDEQARADAARMLHAAEAISLLGFVWIAFQSFTAVRLFELWRKSYGGMGYAYEFTLVTAIVISVLIGSRAAMKIGRPISRHHDDHRIWRLKALYVNPADPALFVPARYGYGLTLNFGRPMAIVIMLAILLAGLGGPILLARALLR
jgi:uncharacterized membrane protein